MKITRTIDHAVLKPAMTPGEVRAAIQLGIDHGVFSVCVQPRDIALAAEMCEGTETLVSCVLDFPHGSGGAQAKREAAKVYCALGAREIDMVMNYGAAKGGSWDVVKEEIRGVVEEAHARGVLVKVIFETCELNERTIREGVDICVEVGADFVKTSTGFAAAGATVEAVSAMVSQAAGRIQVKASGGIRNIGDARRFLEMGVSRLGVGYSTTVVLANEEGESAEAY